MRKIICLFLVLTFFLFSASFALAASPRLYFDTAEIGVNQGDQFDLFMKIDTAGAQVTGADAVVEYNPTYLEVLTIENGNFFPLFGKHYEINSQKIYITGFFTEKNQTKSGNGMYAKLTFHALKNGATALQFNCVDKSLSDTNIIDLNGNDLISCAELTPVKISISGAGFKLANSSAFGRILGTESGALTTPIVIPTEPAGTTSALMETGVFDNAGVMIFMGSIFIVLGGFLLVYSRKSYVS